MINTKGLSFLKSIKFCILATSLIITTFIFLDIPVFKFSKTIDDSIFNFFRNFIDPLSDILDPFKIILLCFFIIFINSNMHRIIKNDIKLRTLRSRTGFSSEKIKGSFSLINLICKHFIYSLAGAGILCNLLKYIAGVSRPKYFFNEGYDRINLFNFEHKVNSFPSGHTQAAFTLAILLIIYTNRFTLIILIFAILMGISRIFMSMHFPSDLLFGAYIGSLIPLLIFDYFFREKINMIYESNKISLLDLGKLLYNRMFI